MARRIEQGNEAAARLAAHELAEAREIPTSTCSSPEQLSGNRRLVRKGSRPRRS